MGCYLKQPPFRNDWTDPSHLLTGFNCICFHLSSGTSTSNGLSVEHYKTLSPNKLSFVDWFRVSHLKTHWFYPRKMIKKDNNETWRAILSKTLFRWQIVQVRNDWRVKKRPKTVRPLVPDARIIGLLITAGIVWPIKRCTWFDWRG